jgi:prepilin-type N-terminal cleavage/methylation domain-containing protein
MSRKGFTLIEISVVVVIIGILTSLAVVRYQKATDKARVNEAEIIFEKVRAGYQADLFEESLPAGWNPGIDAGSDADWRAVGMTNPNAAAKGFFAYQLENGNEMHAYRRNTPGANSADFDAAKWLYMDLDTGQVVKSDAYR